MAIAHSINDADTTNEDKEENYNDDDYHDDDDNVNDMYTTHDANFASRSLYHLKRHWKIIVMGQLLSLCLASAGAAQATLYVDCQLSAPTFTMSTYYLILAIIHSTWLIRKQIHEGQQQRQLAYETHQVMLVDRPQYNFFGLKLQRPTWQYMLMATLDVEANAVTMLAFRYTTLTSVTLLDAVAIPSAMVISKIFLGRQYTWVHSLGVVVCMFGVVLNILQDYGSDSQQLDEETNKLYPHKLWGDILATLGGIMYGLNDTLIEATVRKNASTIEYLAIVGLLGFLLSFVQALILERDAILEFLGRHPTSAPVCSLTKGWALLSVFVGVTVCSYMGGSRFLMVSEAAFFNLSLLTGDFWSLTFSIVVEKIVPRPLFFLALVFVISGVVLYEMAPHPVVEQTRASITAQQQLADIDSEFELQQNQEEDNENEDDDDHDENGMELL